MTKKREYTKKKKIELEKIKCNFCLLDESELE